MKPFFNTLAVVLATLTLGLAGIDTAEAKKGFSGGGSFGSKFSHNKSVKKDSGNGAGKQNAATPVQQKNADRKQQLAKKGGIAGMLGALAIGGVLGALFFGGAFENINFMDILVFALIAFVLFKLFRSFAQKRQQQQQPAAAGGYSDVDMAEDDNLSRRDNGGDAFGGGSSAGEDGLDALRTGIAKGFDEKEFTAGAINCFHRMQRAWSEGDMADIRQFSTDHVFVEIQDRHQQREGDSAVEVVDVKAELLSASDLGSKQEASVMFEAELLEGGEKVQVQEVWHFTRPKNSAEPTWFLDGIQQVED